MRALHAWKSWLAACIAIGYLVVMFDAGRLPEYAHFNPFEAAGLLREPPESVTRVVIARGTAQWPLRREGGQWLDGQGTAVAPELSAGVDDAIRFMHSSAPVRTLAMADVQPAQPTEFGFSADAVRVVLANDSGILLQFELGGRNPDGILRYLRATGQPGILLMSGFIGDAWDNVVTALARAP